MRRLLIVNVNWLGDTLFATPFIRAIRENYPGSYIAMFTHPRCIEVLKGNPNIDNIIIYDRKGQHRGFAAKFSIISQLKLKKFDTAFILRRSLSRAMLIFLSKIPERIGYDNKRAGFLLTRKIPAPAKELHRVEYFLGIARGVGIEPRSINYEFFISENDRVKARLMLEEEGINSGEDFMVLNPGGNWDLKRWPLENFAQLGAEIFSKLNMKVVLTGSQKDVDLCNKISILMKNKAVLLCGKTDLKTLGAVFENAKKVISNDSGPMHIAVAVKASVVALFGPTSPHITGPYGEGLYRVLQKDIGCKIPCYNLSCRDNRCMKAITVEDVIGAIEERK
jgi:heptosyltransferase-2